MARTGVYAVCFLLIFGCSRNETPWRLDARYSAELTVSRAMDESDTSKRLATIDVLQIYDVPIREDQGYDLVDLFKKNLAFETRDTKTIQEFFLATQEATPQLPGCFEHRGETAFHVLAFDATLLRVAYFRYYVCSIDGELHGVVRPHESEADIATTSVYYNVQLPKAIRDVVERSQ